MRSTKEPTPSIDSRRTIQMWLDAADKDSRTASHPANTSDKEGETNTVGVDRTISLLKTVGHMAMWGLVIIPVAGAAVGIYEFNLKNPAVKPPLSFQAEAKSGTADVENLSFIIPPFTAATSEMKTVTIGDLNPILSLGGNDIVMPSILTVKRQNLMTLKFDVTLGEVIANYTPDSRNPIGGALSYSVPNTAVTVEEIISTNDKNSQIDLPVPTNLYQDTVKNIQDINGSAVHILADSKNLVTGTKITAAEVPIVGQLADGSISPKVAMDKFLDENSQSAVANECVPKIAGLNVFSDEFSKSITDYGKLNLFAQESQTKNLKNHLTELMSLPKKQRDAIIGSATVTLMPNFAREIKPNPALQASIDRYKHLKMFSASGVEFNCDTSHMTIIKSDSKGSK